MSLRWGAGEAQPNPRGFVFQLSCVPISKQLIERLKQETMMVLSGYIKRHRGLSEIVEFFPSSTEMPEAEITVRENCFMTRELVNVFNLIYD